MTGIGSALPRRPRKPAVAAILLGGAIATALAVPLTVAQFSAGFSGSTTATGSVDIAQTKSGKSGQHAVAEDASVIEGNGLTVNPVPADVTGWPARETATIEIPVFNRSSVPVTPRLIVRAVDDDEALPGHLLIGASVDGERVGDAPVPATWFPEHRDGMTLMPTIAPGTSRTLAVSVWLASDAPAGALGQATDLMLQVVGETVAGDAPILVEGVWK